MPGGWEEPWNSPRDECLVLAASTSHRMGQLAGREAWLQPGGVAGSPGAPMTAEPLSLLALCALTSNQHTSRRFVSVFASWRCYYQNDICNSDEKTSGKENGETRGKITLRTAE